MAVTHLVDTSVLTRLHRREIHAVVELLASAGQLGRTTISDLEVGYSARNAREWDQLREALEAFDVVEIHARHVDRARQVQASTPPFDSPCVRQPAAPPTSQRQEADATFQR